MATRVYYRDSKGRFAGSGGGSRKTYGKVGVRKGGSGGSRSGGSKARKRSPSRLPARRKSAGFSLSAQAKRRVITAGVAAGVGLGAAYGVRRVLPSQKYATSKQALSGSITTDSINGMRVSRVQQGTVDFVTQTYTTGSGIRRKTNTATIIGNRGKPIGIIYSYRGRMGRTNIVHGSYLTPQSRGKGLGAQALLAHAAHDPRRNHRASIRRSVQGQGFAKKMGGAGMRSRSSKKQGNSITQDMNREWKANKGDYALNYSSLKSSMKGGGGKTINLQSLKAPKRKLRK